MRRCLPPALIAAAVLGAAVLAGCGSSSLSAHELVLRASSVCVHATARTNAVTAPSSAADSARYLRRGAAALAPELAALRALRPPSSLAGTYRVALTAFSQQLADVDAAARSLERGADPVSTIAALGRRLEPLDTVAADAWRALRIPACAQQ